MFTYICGFSAKLTYAFVAQKTRIIFHVIDQIKVKGIVVSRTNPFFNGTLNSTMAVPSNRAFLLCFTA